MPWREGDWSYSVVEGPANDILGAWHTARKFSDAIDRRINRLLIDSELTPRSFTFLHWADRLGNKSLSLIRARAGVSASEATRLVNNLKKTGYIRTAVGSHDERTVTVDVTALGETTIRRAFRLVMADLAKFQKPSRRRADLIDRLLKKLMEEIDANN
jgi:DNA-binding MarR family transcriptional regulator